MLNEERYKFYNLKDQYLQHSGYTPKNPHKEHKYVDIIDGRYIYPEDLEGLGKSKKAKSVPSKAPSPIHMGETKQKSKQIVTKNAPEKMSKYKRDVKEQNVKNNLERNKGHNKVESSMGLNHNAFKNAQADYVMEYSNLIRQADAKTAAEKYFKEDENVDYLLWMIEDGLESGTLSYKNGKFTSTDEALEDDIKHTANWIKGWCDKIGAQSGSGQNMERELKKLIESKWKELGEKYEQSEKDRHEETMKGIANRTSKWAESLDSKSKSKSKKKEIDELTPKEIKKELTEMGKGGNVDLNNRPEISAEDLIDAGYDDAGEGYATVYSATFCNPEETEFYNFTPIIVDPKTGEFKGIIPAEEFDAYCEGVINGDHGDYYNCQIGGAFTGKKAQKKAVDAAIRIHDLHAELHDKNKKKGAK